MKHYSEVDLLELYYSGDRGPAMTHMSDCSECSARFGLLRKKLFEARAASCDTNGSRPETFWTRQRMSILRTVQAQHHVTPQLSLMRRLAVAASLMVLVGTGTYIATHQQAASGPGRPLTHASQTQAPGTSTAEFPVTELAGLPAESDPWDSDALSGYHEAVRWESWIQPATSKNGGPL